MTDEEREIMKRMTVAFERMSLAMEKIANQSRLVERKVREAIPEHPSDHEPDWASVWDPEAGKVTVRRCMVCNFEAAPPRSPSRSK